MLSNTIERYLLKEVLSTWIAVTAVLLVILLGNVLVGSLGRASDGNLSADLVLIFVAVKSTGLLVIVIPLGLYLGVLLALGRLYSDSEITALFACGIGYKNIFRPVIVAGLIGLVIIAMLTILVNPWAARYEQRLKAGMQDTSPLDYLSPGRFVETSNDDSVAFIQSANEEKTRFDDIFIHRESENGQQIIEVADSAFHQINDQTGEEFLVFTDGQITTGKTGTTDFTQTSFVNHGILIPKMDAIEPRLKTKGMELRQLWGSENYPEIAELQWRISLPLASLILALLAIPISHASPRQGRFGKVVIAILIYIPYANLLLLSRKWLADGAVSPWLGMWWVHSLILLLLLVLIVQRLGFTWIRQGMSIPKNRP